MSEVCGLLSVRLWVDCPHCNQMHDLFNMDGVNEENEIWKRVFRDRWYCDQDAWKDIGYEIECSKCKKEFIWNEVEY